MKAGKKGKSQHYWLILLTPLQPPAGPLTRTVRVEFDMDRLCFRHDVFRFLMGAVRDLGPSAQVGKVATFQAAPHPRREPGPVTVNDDNVILSLGAEVGEVHLDSLPLSNLDGIV